MCDVTFVGFKITTPPHRGTRNESASIPFSWVYIVLDDNEKIDNVRGLVSNRKKHTHLIEATRQGHKLEFDKNVLNNVINYAY